MNRSSGHKLSHLLIALVMTNLMWTVRRPETTHLLVWPITPETWTRYQLPH